MIHEPAYVKELIRKYYSHTATAKEKGRLAAAHQLYTEDEMLEMTIEVVQQMEMMIDEEKWRKRLPDARRIISGAAKRQQKKRLFRYAGIAGAAFVLIAFLGISWYLATRLGPKPLRSIACDGLSADQDIPTSQFSCYLQLDQQKPVTIDSTLQGTIRRIGHFELRQISPGILEYDVASGLFPEDTSLYKTITVFTNAHQQYQVVLPDGSRVRLNASSYIRFPVTFSGSERRIELNGEAYLEVTADHRAPFIIKTRNAQLTAFGTAFNLVAEPGYTDVSLVDGRLQLSDTANRHHVMESSGDRAIVHRQRKGTHSYKDTITFITCQNIEQELAWIKADRIYTNASLRKFVMDMCRWYGLEIKSLQCVPSEKRVDASICYNAPLQDVLAILRKQGLTFYQEGALISFCDPAQQRNAETAHHKLVAHYTGQQPIKQP